MYYQTHVYFEKVEIKTTTPRFGHILYFYSYQNNFL